MLHILILEDHPMMVESIKAGIKSLPFRTRTFVANCFRDLSSGARFKEMGLPALVIADLNVPGSSGLNSLHRLRALYPQVPILIFSQIDDPLVERQALEQGASAFLSKSQAPKIFTKTLQKMLAAHVQQQPQVHLAETYSLTADADAENLRMRSLSPQQRRVLVALASGLDAKQIALQMEVADQTIRAHVAEIYQRLDVKSRSQAVVFYLQWVSRQDHA